MDQVIGMNISIFANTVQAIGALRVAFLIDADNAQASDIQELLAEVSRYGTAAIKLCSKSPAQCPP